MATREEILIGFQVIDTTTMGNDVTYHSACFMKKEAPYTHDPLTVMDESADGIRANPRPPKVEDIKNLTEGSCKVVDVEVDTRLRNFLLKFNDDKIVNKGLDYFSTKRHHVDRDVSEVLTHTPNIRVVNQLIPDFKGLLENGNLLGLYEETVDARVDFEKHIPKDYQIINIYQDILNAVAIELQGLCSHSGQPRYETPEAKIEIASARLSAAESVCVQCPLTLETQGFNKVLHYARRNLADAKTNDDLITLGKYVDSHINQLPLLRRWWNL